MLEHESEFGEIDLPQAQGYPTLLLIAWQRKWLVVLGLVVGLAVAVFFHKQSPPLYRSTAQVLVDKKLSDMPVVSSNDANYQDYLATHMELIRSPLIVRRAIQKPEVQNLPVFASQGADPMGAIISSLSVSRGAKDSMGNYTNILHLSCRGPDAEYCGVVLKAVIDGYTEFLEETYRNVSDDTAKLIMQARDILDKDLAKKKADYYAFRKSSDLLRKGKESISIHRERLLNIESKRAALHLRRAELQGKLTAIEKAIKNGNHNLLAALLDQRTSESFGARSPASTLEDQLYPLLVQQKTLEELYGPDHPQVIDVRNKIDLTRKLHARSTVEAGKEENPASAGVWGPVGLYKESLKRDLGDIDEQEQFLSSLFTQEEEKARKQFHDESRDEDFQSDIANTQALYNDIIKKLDQVNLIKDSGGYAVQIVSAPGPGERVDPNLMLAVTIGMLFGSVAGLGLAYLVDLADQSFRTPEEIRHRLGLPVIGHIPMLSPEAKGDRHEIDGEVLDPILYSLFEPTSPEAEAFRGVRTSLYFSTRGEGHQVIQVTSPDKADGKTTLAANLAISMAQSGKRIILIDADFRRPCLHKLFGLTATVGLASVIAEGTELKDAIQESAASGLSVLPCGPLPPNPADLLTSPRLKEVLDVLREQYDFVIIDTPPLLAVTDPMVVAPRVDGVLLTIRLSKNGRPHAERAKEILGSLGAKILGVVVNGVERGTGYSAYRYADGYAYGYGPEKEG